MVDDQVGLGGVDAGAAAAAGRPADGGLKEVCATPACAVTGGDRSEIPERLVDKVKRHPGCGMALAHKGLRRGWHRRYLVRRLSRRIEHTFDRLPSWRVSGGGGG